LVVGGGLSLRMQGNPFNLILLVYYRKRSDVNMKIEKSLDSFISDTSSVKITKMKNITEIMYQKHKPLTMPFIKLSNDEYMLKLKGSAELTTGEVFNFVHNDNRGQDKDSLSATFKKIRNYINNNFTGKKNELHITLTYADNMTDTKQLYKDFQNFWDRFKYKYGECEYLSVIEPQGRGAWHIHLLVQLPKKIFIKNNEELEPLWGNGWTSIRSLSKIDNIGAYLSAYLSDIELTNDIDVGQEYQIRLVDGKEKKFIKGGRVHLYPTGINIFRHSNGIEKPTSEIKTYKEVKELLKGKMPIYTSTIKILSSDDKLLNLLSYEQYNTKRK
jgi:hypothetical protein